MYLIFQNPFAINNSALTLLKYSILLEILPRNLWKISTESLMYVKESRALKDTSIVDQVEHEEKFLSIPVLFCFSCTT
jgi:hypothetical protein